MTTSKDRTMKFWIIKQMQRGEEDPNDPQPNMRVLAPENPKKSAKSKQNVVANDPFNEEENQLENFIKNEGIKKDSNKKGDGSTRAPQNSSNKPETKPKKEDSDDDLAGWDA